MPNYTENYNLKKPVPNENYNVQDQNDNMDIIDQKLKEAMDKAEQAFQSASNGKTGIAAVIGEPADSGDTFAQLAEHISNAKAIMAANLTLKGVIAQATETLAALAAKVANIVRGSGNAKPEDVLAGKTFSNDDGPDQVGTMPNNGPSTAETITLTNQNQEYTISKGYHSGLRKIKAVISGLVASVIKAGVNVGGIEGTFTSDATAVASDLLSGKTAYVNGNKLTGSMPNNGSQSATLTISGSSKPSKTIPAGYTTGGTVTAQVNSNQASHIEDGYNLGGCVGTYKGKYIVDDLTDRFSVPSRSGDDLCGGGIDNDYVYFTGRDGHPPTAIVRFNHSGTMISSANANLVNSYYGGTFNVHGAVFASGSSRDIYIFNASGTMIKTITLAATPQGSYRGVGYTLGRVLYVTNDPLICLDNDSGTRITSQTLSSYYGGFISNFNNTVVFSLIKENREGGGSHEYAGRVYYVPENGNTITRLNETLRFMHININMLKKFFV